MSLDTIPPVQWVGDQPPSSPASPMNRPDSNDATMGSSTGSIASLLLEAEAPHPTSSRTAESPFPVTHTAIKRERSEGPVGADGGVAEVPPPHSTWRRTQDTPYSGTMVGGMPVMMGGRRPPSYEEGAAKSSAASSVEAHLRRELAILEQSYRELQHMYGDKCGEVVVLRRRLQEATASAGSEGGGCSKRRAEGGSLPRPVGGNKGDHETESLLSAPSAAAARLCCELCDVYVTSERSLLYHLEGERHRKRVAWSLQQQELSPARGLSPK